MTLIVMFAAVAVPGPVGSWAFSPNRTPSAGVLDEQMTLREPDFVAQPLRVRSKVAQPTVKPAVVRKPRWRLDGNISWYGPGFYGKRTACGVAMTRGLIGVA